jgi:hypothetical protein
VFFVGYGFAAFFFMRWLARKRVAALNQLSRIGIARRMLASLGILSLAIGPPIAELAARIHFGRYDDLGFLALLAAWVASVFPGTVVSRTTLRAGGIDPDKEA